MRMVAYDLAKRGFRVFPLRPGRKLPLRKGWKLAATSDPMRVLEDWPGEQFAPGIATGADFTVIDVEAAGIATDPAALNLPPTLTFKSGNCGEHYVYRTPPGQAFANSVKKIAPHTDVRGEGGLIVGPGGYVVDPKTGEIRLYAVKHKRPIVDLPTDLAELMRAAPERTADAGQVLGDLDTPAALERARAYLADDRPPPLGPDRNVLPGARGAAAYKAACRLGDFGISAATAYELMLPWNETACVPPQDDDEFARCVEHAYQYRRSAVGQDNPIRCFEEVAPAPAVQLATPRITRVSDFADRPVPPREHHVAGIIPANNTTLLYGDGGTGKSLLSQQLAVATVLGRPFLGRTVERPGPVMLVGAEDDEDELHRRFRQIADKEGVTLEDLRDLHLECLANQDAVLGSADRNELVRPTELWKRIRQRVLDIKPTLVVYDTLADLFSGNENSRTQAQQFVRQLRSLAYESRSTALLLAHPSLSGMASGSGTSGSTGWSNSSRSRLYFSRTLNKESRKELDPDVRTLQVMKINSGQVGLEIKVRWQDWVFVPDTGEITAANTGTQNLQIETKFLELLRTYNAQGRDVSPSRSNAYACTAFERDTGIKRNEWEAAMSRLLNKQSIKIIRVGTGTRAKKALIVIE
jgi:RecA-family ATPase